MVKENSFFQLEISMKDHSKMDTNLAKEKLYFKVVLNLKGIGLRTKLKELGC